MSVLKSIANKIATCVVALISHGIVAVCGSCPSWDIDQLIASVYIDIDSQQDHALCSGVG